MCRDETQAFQPRAPNPTLKCVFARGWIYQRHPAVSSEGLHVNKTGTVLVKAVASLRDIIRTSRNGVALIP